MRFAGRPVRPSLLLFALAACGGPTELFPPRTTCRLETGETVNTSGPADCGYYRDLAQQTRSALLGASFLSEDEYRQLASRTTLWVRSEVNAVFACGGEQVLGCDYPLSDGREWVELPVSGASYLHELLHVTDRRLRGVPEDENRAHHLWAERGAPADEGFTEIHAGVRCKPGSYLAVSDRFFFLQEQRCENAGCGR